MKVILFVLMFVCNLAFAAYEAPEILENACDNKSCTPQMQAIYDSFLSQPQAPMHIPGMYSGVCYHQSQSLAPDTAHYVGVLFDRLGERFYMAPVFQYFGEENSMKDWSLTEARKEMSPDWKNYGPMKVHPTSATQAVLDEQGYPVYIYWARQNPETKTVYMLMVARGFTTAFCEAYPNVKGLETRNSKSE